MQARRVLLLIGIVMLLVVVAASLVPPPQDAPDEGSEENEPTGAVEPPPTSPTRDGGAVEVTFRARSSDEEGGAAKPRGGQGGDGRIGAGPATGEGGDDASSEGAVDPTRGSQTRTAEVGERVLVTVATPNPGGVELEGLGRLQVAAPGAPAVFDLFTDSPGRYDVIYTPAKGNARVLGTLVVGGSSPIATRK